jgi:glycosyltransferase involved in cell wall biosynthesis
LKVSIITVVWNNKETIKAAISSVLGQVYHDIEYIVIDGGSGDGTVNVIEKYRDKIAIFLSEPDKGLYDALNKGIKMSTGDIVAILHSDDVFYDEKVVSDMVERIHTTKAEICFSDLVIIKKNQILRYYKANYFKKWLFRIGWLPPHPTCFIKRSLFQEFGLYSTKYKGAGDFDFLVRIFYARDIKWAYLNRITVKMQYGGISNSGWRSKVSNAQEISKILKNNNVFSLIIFQLLRYFIRLTEMVARPNNYREN